MSRTRVAEAATAATNPPGWDVCITDYRAGTSAVMAIQDVFAALPPPAAIGTVSNIVGSVYGGNPTYNQDGFWDNTCMSWQKLSSALQGAGYGPSDSDRAAQQTFANWRGLFVRKDLNDLGQIPYQGPTPCNSPDIVCNQSGPLTHSTLLNRWNDYFWNYGTVGKNYIYARGSSINIPVALGLPNSDLPQVQMYFTDAGFNIPPTSWHRCTTVSGKYSMPIETSPIQPGDRWTGPTSDPFLFEPPTAEHYCLLSVVQSEFFANNVDQLDPGSNWNSWTWLINNGAAGWHNINVQTAPAARLKFYNLDGRAERFVFEASCENVPAGTTVSLHLPGIRAASGQIRHKHQSLRTLAVIPAQTADELEVRIETPDGKLLPAGASVDVRMYWELEYGHEHYLDGAHHLGMLADVLAERSIRLPMGNHVFIGSPR